jgi:hypothetical protein
MRRWFVGLAMVWGVAAVSGQAQQNVPAQPVPIQVQIQIAPAQIQIAQPAVARANMMIAPGFGSAYRFVPSDVIAVGRVVAFEPMDVEATPAANQAKANYRIAIVQVTEAIHGVKKDMQTIRVGFVAPANAGPNGGIIGGGGIGGGIQVLPAAPQRFIGGARPYMPAIQFQMGQDGIFKLTKHHKENFYIAPNYTCFINRQNNANFDTEVRSAKQLAKVMNNPTAALKADDGGERILAAAVLINRYRSTTGAMMKQVPIDAAESKLILKALGQSDWSVGRASDAMPHGPEMFNQLGVTQKDGYNPILRNQQDLVKAMQTWLTDNADKYVIRKFVADPNAKPNAGSTANQPGAQPGKLRPAVRPLPPIKAQPFQGKVQILPVIPQAVPAAPPQLNDAPVPQDVPAPLRRD